MASVSGRQVCRSPIDDQPQGMLKHSKQILRNLAKHTKKTHRAKQGGVSKSSNGGSGFNGEASGCVQSIGEADVLS